MRLSQRTRRRLSIQTGGRRALYGDANAQALLFSKAYALGEVVVCSHGADDKTQFTGLVEGRKGLLV